MDRPKRHRAFDFEKFLDYFKGLFSGKEQHRFEKEIMRDSFAEEAYEGLSGLTAQELEQDMHELQAGLATKAKTRKTVFFPVFRIAAAAILLLIAGTTVVLLRNSIKKAPVMQDMAEALDTVPPQRLAPPGEKDSLKEDIAYIPEKKEEEKPVVRKAPRSGKDAGTPVSEPIAQVSEEAIEEMEIILPLEEDFAKSSSKEEIEITAAQAEDAEQSLQGAAAGVRIRGQSSLRAKGKTSSERQMETYTYSEEASGEIRTVKGLVFEAESGEPLPGVTVILSGTSQGTITDIEGQFLLEVPAHEESSLTFAYVGYESEEIEIAKTVRKSH